MPQCSATDLRSLKEMDFDNWDGISGWTVKWIETRVILVDYDTIHLVEMITAALKVCNRN